MKRSIPTSPPRRAHKIGSRTWLNTTQLKRCTSAFAIGLATTERKGGNSPCGTVSTYRLTHYLSHVQDAFSVQQSPQEAKQVADGITRSFSGRNQSGRVQKDFQVCKMPSDMKSCTLQGWTCFKPLFRVVTIANCRQSLLSSLPWGFFLQSQY